MKSTKVEPSSSQASTVPDSDLPSYHDSEPPPRYAGKPPAPKQLWTTGASAAAVRAVLAQPSSNYVEEKRTWKDRWKELWTSDEEFVKREREREESSARWNI